MANRTITLTVDQGKFFDTVLEHVLQHSDCPIGSRVIACLLGGVDFLEAVGLRVYGIEVKETPQERIQELLDLIEADRGFEYSNHEGTEALKALRQIIGGKAHPNIGDR